MVLKGGAEQTCFLRISLSGWVWAVPKLRLKLSVIDGFAGYLSVLEKVLQASLKPHATDDIRKGKFGTAYTPESSRFQRRQKQYLNY